MSNKYKIQLIFPTVQHTKFVIKNPKTGGAYVGRCEWDYFDEEITSLSPALPRKAHSLLCSRIKKIMKNHKGRDKVC